MKEFIATQPKAVGLGLRVMGHKIFPYYPFEEAFFLPSPASSAPHSCR
jgi:hypothetical protein